MTFSSTLVSTLSSKHLLKHPFYQAWTQGKLTQENLREYAEQYYPHVAAFPRFLSATHSNCKNIEARQVLLENLIDEEKGADNHPELWLRFAESVGAHRDTVTNAIPSDAAQNLVDTFLELSQSSYAEGLGALFAYEHQVPEIAKTKIEGLEKFYGITSKEGLSFFQVHLEADVHHTNATAKLLDAFSPEDQKKAQAAATKASNVLWNFLSSQSCVKSPHATC